MFEKLTILMIVQMKFFGSQGQPNFPKPPQFYFQFHLLSQQVHYRFFFVASPFKHEKLNIVYLVDFM